MIPRAIESVFGKSSRRNDYSDSVLIVRHGFASNHIPFKPLSAKLRKDFKGITVENADYTWTKPVVENGVELALHIQNTYDSQQSLCLIGHSMGGLVCRIANVALNSPTTFQTFISQLESFSGSTYLGRTRRLLAQLHARKVSGLVTLATPNSATLTYGQIASWMKMSSVAATLGFPNKTSSFVDLTTDRVFRILQNFSVGTPAFSISGSAHNRFAKTKPALGVVVGLAANLAIPNDGLVEDRSVDLRASILPNEICHMGNSKYLHLREYSDCTDVTHSGIYDAPSVYNSLVAFLERIL